MPSPPSNSGPAQPRRAWLRLTAVVLVLGLAGAVAIDAATSDGGTTSGSPTIPLGQALTPSSSSRFLPAMTRHPVPAAAADSSLGVNAQFLFPLFGQVQWRMQARLMRQSGIQIVRADASWGDAEPDPPSGSQHRYHWGYFDAIEETLAGARLRWLPIVDFSAPWDASYSQGGTDPKLSAPRDPQLFGEFAAALVGRYGPDGSFWRLHPRLPRLPVQAVEVWNEENTATFWQPAPSAEQYLNLYEHTRSAIHAVSPRVEVIVGGLANPASAFLSQLYADGRGRRDLLQAVAVHPYDANAQEVIDNVVSVRSFLDGHGGLDVPIDVTEFGWPTRGDSTSLGVPTMTDDQRAAALSQVTDTLATSDCGVERILPHTWITQENSLLNPAEWFGLANPNGSLTRSAEAYARTIETLEVSSRSEARLRECRGPLALQVELVRATRARRGAHRPAARRPDHTSCVLVRVGYGMAAVNDATIRLAFTPTPGRPPARAQASIPHTNDRGYTRGCLYSRRRTTGTLRVTATRSDFASSSSSELPITLP